MTARSLLALIRPPNVFTAFADSLAGLLLCWGAGRSVPDRACAILLVSGCLYLSGIVLNDLFDAETDRRERPMRPIPSGAVRPVEALVLGGGLLLGGLTIAWWIGPAALSYAVLLAACILLYDGGLKRTRLGPVVMGSCRGLDLALGVAAGLGTTSGWPDIAIAGSVVLGAYITGLTYIARDEVDGNTTRRARTGLAFLALLGGAVIVAIVLHPPSSLLAWGWIATALVMVWRNWAPVWSKHDGPTTGRAIGGGIVLIPIIDAAVCAYGGCPLWAGAVAALAVPAIILKSFFSPT
jgi:4-hydroxybenzoate polyprenyltransferase